MNDSAGLAGSACFCHDTLPIDLVNPLARDFSHENCRLNH